MARRASSEEDRPNVNPNDEAECAALYEDHMASMARVKQKIATMFNRYEKMGVSADAVKYNYRLAQQADGEAIHRQRTLTSARLGTIQFDKHGQADFSEAINAAKPNAETLAKLVVARASTDGFNTGLGGGLIDACPHPVGSEQFVRWRDGWSDGRAVRIERKPELANVTQAEPRKRGRPPGSKNKTTAAADGQEQAAPSEESAASLH